MDPLVNIGLHVLRVAHVDKGFYAFFGSRLDNYVARVNEALEHALVKVHDIDFVQRNFNTLAGDDSRLENDALRREHEMRAIPLQRLQGQVQHGENGQDLRSDEGEVFEEIVRNAMGVCQRGEGDNDDDDRLHEPPPMRVQIEHQHFVVAEVFH